MFVYRINQRNLQNALRRTPRIVVGADEQKVWQWGRRLFRKCRPRAKIATRLHLEVPFRTISTHLGRIVRKEPPVGPAAVYRLVAGTFFFRIGRSQNVCQTSKWIWYDWPSETHLGRLDRRRFCRAFGSRVGLYYVGTQLASSLYHEAGTRHVVPGESALLQKAHSGRCRLFCPEVSFTLIATGDDLLPSLLCWESISREPAEDSPLVVLHF